MTSHSVHYVLVYKKLYLSYNTPLNESNYVHHAALAYTDPNRVLYLYSLSIAKVLEFWRGFRTGKLEVAAQSMLETSCSPEIRAGKSEVSAQISLKTTLLPDVRAGKSKVHAQNVLEICLLLECRAGTLELLSKVATSSQTMDLQ